ncbi:UDP-N-acetylmuramoyl-L-alanyl-D-glutamate--2,6-diaminopimelate ligase [Chengkuizengella axinellae]|uniref:UDP-N-acetylmuramoyl-L-alanyl-D-glutamate--2,6-diaminopimelate ligase n=1 Tax=Chengkuizengella axinellae TaxID=3064388 RepID=A0ABT9J211_9BACL|nr:UDP-N-acetylmuramoyl-L-alanyl-D-glutamate--2,6-diaminopimelate ligase [Chengkuizengella sp. 2205SS18-9]MDP5275648.1 UDP-N-acetylmuramoyl-L-alanyl-D-glutamate--2,6-diaminopimelate ligase [Chengkuizengella sp. 2205SS18-9]
MKLYELLQLIPGSRIVGDSNKSIQGIEVDSRLVKPGDLFICIIGFQMDGHHYASQAIKQGAAALVTNYELDVEAPQIIVKNSRFALAIFSNHFFNYPSQKLKLIGVTGTNGKTTTTYLLEKILQDRGFQTGLMGTIEMKIGNRSHEVKNTTQDVLELQRSLSRMVESGAQYCVMEASSHGLELGRVKGCDFKTAIFTNLTQDHLDFHMTMEQYREAKSLLFSRLGNIYNEDPEKRKTAILNADDPSSVYFEKVTAAHVITYGIDQEADVRAKDVKTFSEGTSFRLESYAGNANFRLNLIGKFSVYNVLAAIAAALAEGLNLQEIKSSLEAVEGINGRFEKVSEGQDFSVIVDYSHTPDSLENVLTTIKQFAKRKVICVFGCGGDRDRTKRPMMGEIVGKYSDYCLITSDNPRTENGLEILKDIEPGVISAGKSKDQYDLFVDRKQAIEKAIEMANCEDVVLIAGKGHENYQEINGIRYDFDDRLIAKKTLKKFSVKRL